jgi:micrococcal nuclease
MNRRNSLIVAAAFVFFLLLSAYSVRNAPLPRIPKLTQMIAGVIQISITPISVPIITQSKEPFVQSMNNFVPVVHIVDGDTIDVEIDGEKKRIRLIGADTPEVVDPRKTVQCFGVEASEKTKSLLTGKTVRLETDPTQGDKDIYGRLLRYVYLEDGTLVNKLLISEGFAHEYTYKIPYRFQKEFKKAEKDAENGKVGLWADGVCGENVY